MDTQLNKENPVLGGAGSGTENDCVSGFSIPIPAQNPPENTTTLKRSCIHLADQDRECLRRICAKLDLPSSALAVRYAIRTLARRLEKPALLADKAGQL